MDGRAKREGEGILHYCIRCGGEFIPANPDVVLCHRCGGPPEGSLRPSHPAPTRRDASVPTIFEESSTPEDTPHPISVPSQRYTEPESQAVPTPTPDAGKPGRRFATAGDVPAEWHKGDVILDLYEVRGALGEGGFGKVYRVHHQGWNIDLAVKSPNAKALQRAGGVEDFTGEAETWMDLGLHPHIVTCHYVRMLGTIPRVFAELVEGGSLKDWIQGRRLYEGGREKALERVLDVAIQFAWGLHYAHEHEQGLVHQDVKPENVMMTPDGVTKVTDFGLAKARPVADVEVSDGRGGTHLVKGRGMTPEYCSPEQAAGQFLTRRTDIWSWGVSILEIFVGERTWMSGVAAPGVLEMYLEGGTEVGGLPPMPPALANLLRQCFQDDPEARPADMLGVAERLEEIYHQEIGQPYPRQMPQAVELRADSLNNKALSLLDLGQEEEAVAAWQEALEADPHHAEATYNLGLWRWRAAKQTDEELVRQLEAVMTAQKDTWKPQYLLGLVHLERGDGKGARTALKEAARLAPKEQAVQEALARVGKAQTAGSLRTFVGHKSGVEIVVLTPDGRYAISTSGWELWLWDVENGRFLHTFGQFGVPVSNVVVTPDGRLVVSSAAMALWIWELRSGRRLYFLKGHRADVRTVALTPDGHRVLSGSVDRTLRLWDLESGRCLRTFEGHQGTVCAVAITPDGRYAVSGSRDRTLRLWDLESGRCLRTFEGHEDDVNTVAVIPDGRFAVSGSDDRTLRLWDLKNGECLCTFEGHEGEVWDVAITPNGRYALSRSGDRTLRLWDLESRRCRHVFKGHKNYVSAVALTPDGRCAVSSSRDKTLRLWELASGRCLRTFKGHKYEISDVAITPDGRFALSGEKETFGSGHAIETECELQLWGLQGVGEVTADWGLSLPASSAQAVQEANAAQLAIRAARASLAKGQLTEAGAALRRARSVPGYERDPELLDLWHQAGLQGGRRTGLRGGRCLRTLEGHTDYVYAVAVSADRRTAVSGSRDNTLLLWDLESGECLHAFKGHENSVSTVAFTPEGHQAVSGSWDNTLRLWDLESGVCLRIFEGHQHWVRGVTVSPDGRYAVSCSWDKTLRLWDLESGACLRTFEGHKEFVEAVTLTPDGHDAVSASHDYTLRQWDLVSGACRQTFKGHGNWVGAVAISPEGRFVLSGGGGNDPAGRNDNTLRLWDLASGKCLRRFEGHTEAVRAAVFTPGGRFALSGSGDNTLRLWEVASGECSHVFEGHRSIVIAVALTPDGRFAVSAGDYTLRLWELDWDYEFPEPADWDEGARPYLEIFLTLHTPYGPDGIGRVGTPTWTEQDFQHLLTGLGYRGYGWLRLEGVRQKLEQLARSRRFTE